MFFLELAFVAPLHLSYLFSGGVRNTRACHETNKSDKIAKKKKVTRNVPEKANVTSSEEDNEDDNDNMEHSAKEMDNKKAKRHRSTNPQDKDKSEMMEMMRDMTGSYSKLTERWNKG
jgi:hypothetical protein